MPLGFREFCVVLRHVNRDQTSTTNDFTAIVSAEDLVGAQLEAQRLVENLNGLVTIVSVMPREKADPKC